MKATVGSISTKGTLGWSKVTDSAGGLAKSAGDLAALMGVLLNGTNFDQNLTYSWEGLRVGFVDKSLWDFVPAICNPDPILREQQDLAYDEAMTQIKFAGGSLKHPVPLPSMKDLEIDGQDVLDKMWSKSQQNTSSHRHKADN
jgi:Asp-tRNA(Asn)/Glu-tRNA(Gln) amidotransferase A subunit family amidase